MESARHMQEHWDVYQKGADQLTRDLLSLFSKVPESFKKQYQEVSADTLKSAQDLFYSLLGNIVNNVSSLILGVLLTMLYTLFWLCSPVPMDSSVDVMFRKYIMFKTLACFGYGISAGLLLYFLSVDLASVFALTTFALNFVPEVGPFIAMVLPCPVIILDSRIDRPMLVLFVAILGQLALKFAFSNIIEVKLIESDKKLRMHPVMILLRQPCSKPSKRGRSSDNSSAANKKIDVDRLEKQVDDTRALRDKSVRDRDCWLHERETLVQDKLQEKRDLEEKVFAAQTRSKNLEHRCQELEETLKQERNNEQLLHAQKDLEQRESLLNSRNQELQARLLEAERNTEELQRLRLELQVNKQQLDEKEADLTQQKNEWKLRAQEREQKYRNWESQRQEVEQQNERTAKELQSMVQQSQEKVMEEVRKRTALEKDLRQLNEEKLRINEERAKLNQEKGQLGEQQAKLHEEKAKLQEHIEQQKLEIGNLQKQVAMEHTEVVTPSELKRRALAQDSDLSKRNAEMMHDVAAFELEMKWLASCNSVLRQHVPTELEATVKAAIENLNGSDWQPPSEEADDVFNVDLGRRAKLSGEIPLLRKSGDTKRPVSPDVFEIGDEAPLFEPLAEDLPTPALHISAGRYLVRSNESLDPAGPLAWLCGLEEVEEYGRLVITTAVLLKLVMVLLIVLHLGASAALQSNEVCAYPDEDLSGNGSTARNIAAGLNVFATLVACMSPTQRQRFSAALHLAMA
ncbi:unnamed protein product [Symbiodinium microadriaticum]|nr:unnamed protein product [Symbiodinium microadriaticum]